MKIIAREFKEQEERSLLWSFCQAADVLNEQFLRLENTGSLSYSLLASLVGEPSQKGLLWYLKDKAHTLFACCEESNSPGALLDWSLGYIFHECVKLTEDTRLQQAYMVRFDNVTNLYPQHRVFFTDIEKQTRRSISLESNRLVTLIEVTIDLFADYFAGCVAHRPLARLLFDQENFFRRVFAERYVSFLQSVYGATAHCLYVEAGYSLLEAGKFDRARDALDKALILSSCDEVSQFEQHYVNALSQNGRDSATV